MKAFSPLHLSFGISPQIHISAPSTLQKAVTLQIAEFQIYFLIPQVEFMCLQNGLLDIQLNSRGQMKRGLLLCCHLASLPWGIILFTKVLSPQSWKIGISPCFQIRKWKFRKMNTSSKIIQPINGRARIWSHIYYKDTFTVLSVSLLQFLSKIILTPSMVTAGPFIYSWTSLPWFFSLLWSQMTLYFGFQTLCLFSLWS